LFFRPKPAAVSSRVTTWRTNPSIVLITAKELAEKFHDLGWRRLSAAEKRRIRKLGIEVCQRLGADKAQDLAGILKITLPPDFVPASPLEVMQRGKNSLMQRIRDTFRSHGRKLATGPPLGRGQPYTEEQILFCAQVIARALSVKEVWLFGSIARGDFDDRSDVDLLVILPDDHKYERPTYEAVLALMRAPTSVPTDVLVITEAQKKSPQSVVVEDALREGRRLL
jgi:predicted nucleotidyltransferase